jgi:predicted lysophospholipase L1 biosynthesis ABC-type transport system permease subunit
VVVAASGYDVGMSNPAAQPRRLFLAFLVLAALIALVLLLANGQLLVAIVVGVLAVVALVAGARPAGANRS